MSCLLELSGPGSIGLVVHVHRGTGELTEHPLNRDAERCPGVACPVFCGATVPCVCPPCGCSTCVSRGERARRALELEPLGPTRQPDRQDARMRLFDPPTPGA